MCQTRQWLLNPCVDGLAVKVSVLCITAAQCIRSRSVVPKLFGNFTFTLLSNFSIYSQEHHFAPFCSRSQHKSSSIRVLTKVHFYKNNAKPPILPKKLHDPAPYFRQTRTRLWGRIVQIFLEYRRPGFALFL